MTENDRNIILIVMGDNKLLDALKCWLLMLYMIVCVVLLYLCTYKIIYIHQAHICILLFFFCPFSTCHFFYFCQKYLPLEHDLESEEGHFLPLEEGVKHLPNLHILHFSVK